MGHGKLVFSGITILEYFCLKAMTRDISAHQASAAPVPIGLISHSADILDPEHLQND